MSLTLKVTIILTLGWGLALLLRRASASMRHAVWASAMLAAIALPALEQLLPATIADPTGGFLVTANAVAAGTKKSSGGWLMLVWLAGVAAVMARTFVAHVRVERIRLAAGRIGEYSGIPLLRSPEDLSPMAAGWLRPAIVLPASSGEWGEPLRESVLRHEVAHIRRGDLWWSRLAQAFCAALWFHPLAWLAAREMRREAEGACDDIVLASGTMHADYAEHLIRVARSTSAAPTAAVAMTGKSPFESRVRAILNSRTSRRPVNALIVALAGVVVFAPLAAFQEPQPSEHRENIPPRLIWKVEPKYTEEARDAKIEGKVVLSVVVTREGRADEIQIVQSLDPGLDQQAIQAVQQWEFEPATKKGERVAARATIEVNFRLM
jgi:TonB family protein